MTAVEFIAAHDVRNALARAAAAHEGPVDRHWYEPEWNTHLQKITDLIESGKLSADIGLPQIDPATDRVMICGSEAMLKDACKLLDSRGFQISPRQGEQGDYVIERAFVEK